MAVWLSGNAFVSITGSYSTSGPVSTWMGNRFRTSKPSPYVTSHPSQLNLAIPPWIGAMSTSKKPDSKRAQPRYTSPVSVVSKCKLVSGWGLRKRRSAPPHDPCGSAAAGREWVRPLRTKMDKSLPDLCAGLNYLIRPGPFTFRPGPARVSKLIKPDIAR